MNVFELTRALVDIESITENEERVGNALFAHLSELAARHGGLVERIPVQHQEIRFKICEIKDGACYSSRNLDRRRC